MAASGKSHSQPAHHHVTVIGHDGARLGDFGLDTKTSNAAWRRVIDALSAH